MPGIGDHCVQRAITMAWKSDRVRTSDADVRTFCQVFVKNAGQIAAEQIRSVRRNPLTDRFLRERLRGTAQHPGYVARNRMLGPHDGIGVML